SFLYTTYTSRPVFLLPFSVYLYGDHLDLHSFPTRRSSDLRKLLQRRLRGADTELAWRLDVELLHDAVLDDHREALAACAHAELRDRKSTRLNSSHVKISYAVFCLKKKKKYKDRDEI